MNEASLNSNTASSFQNYYKNSKNPTLFKKYRHKSLSKQKESQLMKKNNSMSDIIHTRNIRFFIKNKKKNYPNYYSKSKDKNKNSNYSFGYKTTSPLSITNNTFNMNKNNVLINLNTNIINTNSSLEKYKVQQKLMEYRKIIDKKINELNRNRNSKLKNLSPFGTQKKNKICSSSIIRYEHISKYNINKRNNKRTLTPNQIIKVNSKEKEDKNKNSIIKKKNESIDRIKSKTKIKDFTKFNFNNFCGKKNLFVVSSANSSNNIGIISKSSNSNRKDGGISSSSNGVIQKTTLKNLVYTKSSNNTNS